jgi:predicted nucleotidyltransferase
MKFDLSLPRAAVGRKELRDFLLAYRWVDRPITTKEIKEFLKWKIWDAAPELVGKGMLEKIGRGKYRVTKLGERLAVQNLIPRISRTKADQLVAELLDRARRINDDHEQVDYVAKIIAFGSYIRPDADDLGDIDLVIETKRRPISDEEFQRRSEALRVKAEQKPDLKKLLRSRCRYLSFHPEHDLMPEFPSKVIFAAEGPETMARSLIGGGK